MPPGKGDCTVSPPDFSALMTALSTYSGLVTVMDGSMHLLGAATGHKHDPGLRLVRIHFLLEVLD